jgi:hypothetical protein
MSINVQVSHKDTLSYILSEGNDRNGAVVLPIDVDLRIDKLVVRFESASLSAC